MRISNLCLTMLNTPMMSVKNMNIPSCINCIHFIEHKTNYPYDYLPDNKNNGKCKLFGEKNIVSGEIDNLYALQCRTYDNLCGREGKHYEEKK